MTFFSHQCKIPKPEGVSRCFYCGRQIHKNHHEPDNPTWDHKLPTSRGGVTLPANMVLACASCNRDKGSLTLEEYRAFYAAFMMFNRLRINQLPVKILRWKFYGERLPENNP